MKRSASIVFGLFVFFITYLLAISNLHISYYRKSSGESIIHISGKNSFIIIDIRDKKTKQVLYIQE